MDIVQKEAEIISYKEFEFNVRLFAYYCADSNQYYTDESTDKQNNLILGNLYADVITLRRECGISLSEIQRVYNIKKTLDIDEFKSYYQKHGPKF